MILVDYTYRPPTGEGHERVHALPHHGSPTFLRVWYHYDTHVKDVTFMEGDVRDIVSVTYDDDTDTYDVQLADGGKMENIPSTYLT